MSGPQKTETTTTSKKIKKFLNSLLKRRDRYFNNIKREYFMKWHLYTKVLGLKAIINDKRRKK